MCFDDGPLIFERAATLIGRRSNLHGEANDTPQYR
jgi:hypothetical protein